MNSHLYCMKFDAPDTPIAKVGVSGAVRSRFASIARTAPYPATLLRLFCFSSADEAKCWERRILTLGNRYREQGEWVLADDRLNQLLDEVRGGDDLTEHFASTYRGRLISIDRAYGTVARNGIAGTVDFRAAVRTRLADGYGVEDIAVKDGFDVALVRAEVQRLRASGFFKRKDAA